MKTNEASTKLILDIPAEQMDAVWPMILEMKKKGCQVWLANEWQDSPDEIAESEEVQEKDEQMVLEEDSDLCGKINTDLSWKIDPYGVLWITGKGRIPDYAEVLSKTPWHDYEEMIKKIVIEEGVTAIGQNTFYGYENLESVELPASVRDIRISAFENCMKLKEVTIPNEIIMNCTAMTARKARKQGVAVWTYAFRRTPWAVATFGEFLIIDGVVKEYLGVDEEIRIPDVVSAISDDAFSEQYIKAVTIGANVKRIGARAFTKSSVEKVIFEGVSCDFGKWIFFDVHTLKEIYINHPDFVPDFEIYHPDNVVIYGAKGSRAEVFARENRCAFETI